MTVSKKEVILLLEKIALYMELSGANSFKVRAFHRASKALEQDERSIEEIDCLHDLPGIGKKTELVINEFIKTGHSHLLETLQNQVPKGFVYLLQIPGLGPKTIAKLHKQLGIETVDDLKKACLEGKIRNIKGFGEKTERNLLESIRKITERPARIPLAHMLPHAQWVESRLMDVKGIERFSRAGSLRRLKETLKDLDFVVATNNPKSVREQIIQFPHLKKIANLGESKVSCEFAFDIDVSVDFRIVRPEHFATTLHHFTGSKKHNVRMRQIAKGRKEKISEYGVEKIDTGERITFETEKTFYAHFDLPFISPELREDGSEIEQIDELPGLVTEGNIKGDLHMHTNWSDGVHSIEQMVEACRRRGYSYMAITDHSKHLAIANGLTEDRVQTQLETIQTLNDRYSDITILSGIELDILPDGSLDLTEDVLQQLDIVIASIHSAFHQSEAEIMRRFESACKNRYVNIIAHPTGRIIGRRDGYSVDIEQLFQLAKETNTALELNASPKRLDLKPELLMKGKRMGVKFVINTDAHSMESLSNMEIGVKFARKAWLTKEMILNTWDLDRLLPFFKEKNRGKG
ncbi:DNA polymerase/3'-5' exonuclease PolX [Fervidibacillus albus]|uniref:DNA-directed DNA polymerase n=1 Tax=Fervidibacillus albus TaxID=2980026 RepID=A0A9E8RWL4_9BACI|nr:DNA polymerase/3'-5' exonuclease PolX [Fervidibacillus albus]WAA10203.1 DNA polymerase/3'-5' exonuclease PolX [Fervidibacillus albus]